MLLSRPLVFCAPTLSLARRAAWQALGQTPSTPFSLPLVLGASAGHSAWRDLARAGAGHSALVLPRLVAPERYFARAHAGNARARAWGGLSRLWTLAKALRRIENDCQHLDFDADDTGALRDMATLIAQMRRQNRTALPVGDDYGRELDRWRAAYDDELADLNAFDFEAAPALFLSGAQGNRTFAWPQTLVLDHLGEISPALKVGLDALVENARTTVGTLVLSQGRDDEIARRARAFWEKHDAHFVEDGSSTPRLRVARALLDASAPPFESAPPDDLWVTLAHTRADECERIAAHIRRAIEAGARAREFVLVAPDPSGVERPLRAAFAATGIELDWPFYPDSAAHPLVARLLRTFVPRSAWSADELHDLLGDGALRFSWTGNNGLDKSLNAGRLRRALRCVRGQSEQAPWRDPRAVENDWRTRIEKGSAAFASRGDEAKARLLAASLDGGDLEGIEHLRALWEPFAAPLTATQWRDAALANVAALAGHWDEDEEDTSSALKARQAAREGLRALRSAIEAVAARAQEDDHDWPRSAVAWAAWLRLELVYPSDEAPAPHRGAGVRVLRADEVVEAGNDDLRGVFVVGLNERAWPRPRAQAPWPRATSQALEALWDTDAPPLSRALHAFARLVALPCPLLVSRSAWTDGTESGASPLWEDLEALFPQARWRALPRPSSETAPATRSRWLAALSKASVGESAEFARRLGALSQMQRERSALDSLGAYDGVLGERGRELLAPLLPRDGGRLEASASGLELYARCPLRFFFERVLGLPCDDGSEDDLSRAESGDLVHRVLHAFLREWRAPLSVARFDAARETLVRLTQRDCQTLGLAPILARAEARRLLGTLQRPGPLVRLLLAECHETQAAGSGVWASATFPLLHLERADWTLAHPGNGLEQGFRVELGPVLVKGRIDRLDASLDGSLVLVLDYKTGSHRSLPRFDKGSDRLHFQLAVYVLAARALTQGWPHRPRIAASYLSPRGGFSNWVASADALGAGGSRAMSDELIEKWLADSATLIERVAAHMEAGTFNLSLQSAQIARCDECAQRALCGQNSSRQSARAQHHRASPHVYLPEPVEWEAS